MTDQADTTDGIERSRDAITWQMPESRRQFNLLLLGDTAFGASYQEPRAEKGKTNFLRKYGYDHGFVQVEPLLQNSDLVIANLETPLTRRRESPFEDIRTYIHYDDPELSLRHLRAHNIGAVTLANNHTHDMGEAGLLDTLEALQQHDMPAVGAGRSIAKALRPLEIRADINDSEPFIASIFARFWGGREFRDVLKAYATEDRPGSAPFNLDETARTIAELRENKPNQFIIVSPHWRRDYKWASERQREAADRLITAGADLIVGHGSHMAQEIDFRQGRLVLNGIGNFLFNSPGRYRRMEVPPYSLMARLTVGAEQIAIRTYPIQTDNRVTKYQPTPVTRAQFDDFYRTALELTNDPRTFRTHARAAEDEYGHHLAITLRRDGRLHKQRRYVSKLRDRLSAAGLQHLPKAS